jgi:hypothetical protein
MEEDYKVRENRLRRKAERVGLKLEKSRRRDPDAPDFGRYRLCRGNMIIAGYDGTERQFAWDLDEAEYYFEHSDFRKPLGQNFEWKPTAPHLNNSTPASE